jgi:hypothetical protein
MVECNLWLKAENKHHNISYFFDAKFEQYDYLTSIGTLKEYFEIKIQSIRLKFQTVENLKF